MKKSFASRVSFLLSDNLFSCSRFLISGLAALISIFRFAVGVHGSPGEISFRFGGVVRWPEAAGWISAKSQLDVAVCFRGVFTVLSCALKHWFSWAKKEKTHRKTVDSNIRAILVSSTCWWTHRSQDIITINKPTMLKSAQYLLSKCIGQLHRLKDQALPILL